MEEAKPPFSCATERAREEEEEEGSREEIFFREFERWRTIRFNPTAEQKMKKTAIKGIN